MGILKIIAHSLISINIRLNEWKGRQGDGILFSLTTDACPYIGVIYCRILLVFRYVYEVIVKLKLACLLIIKKFEGHIIFPLESKLPIIIPFLHVCYFGLHHYVTQICYSLIALYLKDRLECYDIMCL